MSRFAVHNQAYQLTMSMPQEVATKMMKHPEFFNKQPLADSYTL